MHPKKHAKVEPLTQARQKALDALYYTAANGQRVATYSPEVMAQKVKAIEEKYDNDLRAMMDAAEKQAEAAAAILARVDRPFDWLTADELARAATLAPFVREDFAALDAAGLVRAVESAAGAGRSEKWLAYRYAGLRYNELDRALETAPGMVAKAQYAKATAALRDDIMPPTLRRERADAQRQHDDAQDLYDAAEWARPSVRQEFAAKFGIRAEYLPA